jgi:hypothetical protein
VETTTKELPGMLWTPDEAAKATRLCVKTLRNARDLPCVRIGRAVRYVPADVAAWIERRKTAAGAT